MKLGTETNNLINNLYSRMVVGEPAPEVGMGVTMLSWTDRSPGTIKSVSRSGKSLMIEVSPDQYKVVSGSAYDGSAEYEYSPASDNMVAYMFRKNNKSGKWESVSKNPLTNRWMRSSDRGLRIGERERYYDPSF